MRNSSACMQQHHHFKTEITKTTALDYLLYTPKGYQPNGETTYPLVLFLHGAGQRGAEATRVAETAIPEMVAQQQQTPYILLAPQCPPDQWWVDYEAALIALLNETIITHAVDQQRVYLTGLSMGGAGTWYLASKHPHRFAAIAPICGASLWWQGFPENAEKLKSLPIWTFHGEADSVVPISVTEAIVAVLEQHQANVQFTRYPGVEHNSWTETYGNPDLYQWLFQHRLPANTIASIDPAEADNKGLLGRLLG